MSELKSSKDDNDVVRMEFDFVGWVARVGCLGFFFFASLPQFVIKIECTCKWVSYLLLEVGWRIMFFVGVFYNDMT